MKRIFLVMTFLILFLVPLFGRTFYEADLNLERAREFRSSQQYHRAIEYYRRAISWRAPFNQRAYLAGIELYEMINQEVSDDGIKLDGLRELRSGYFGSRSIVDQLPALSSSEAKLREIISQLDQQILIHLPAGENRDPYLITNGAYQENSLVQLFAQIAFWGWIASVLLFIFKGFTKDGLVIKPVALRCAGLIFLFFGSWLVLLRFA